MVYHDPKVSSESSFSLRRDSAELTMQEKPQEIEDTTTEIQTPARVILFNDDWHTFDEVIGQLIKALGCGSEKAEGIAFEAHSKGKALVFEGAMSDCLRVNGVLEEISLVTQIEV